MKGLDKGDEHVTSDAGEVNKIVREYFMELFTSQSLCDSDYILRGVNGCISEDMNRRFTA